MQITSDIRNQTFRNLNTSSIACIYVTEIHCSTKTKKIQSRMRKFTIIIHEEKFKLKVQFCNKYLFLKKKSITNMRIKIHNKVPNHINKFSKHKLLKQT